MIFGILCCIIFSLTHYIHFIQVFAKVYSVDKADLAILKRLQENAKTPNSELARHVNLSESACLARTKRLMENGIIKQFVCVLDPPAVGMEVMAFTFVTLDRHNRKTAKSFVDRIKRTPNVMECYNVTGQWDYLLKVFARGISDYRDFVIDQLLEIEGVDKVETLIVMKAEKQIYSLPLPSHPERSG